MKVDTDDLYDDSEVHVQNCMNCNEEMDYWNAEMTKKNAGETSLDEAGEVWIVWSEKDCKEAGFCYCPHCHVLQVTHKKCNEAMQCLGHQGYYYDGTEHMRDSKTKMKVELTKPGKFDPNVPRFAIGDLAQYKLRLDEWAACGPNYDQKHFWTCGECKVDFAFSAK